MTRSHTCSGELTHPCYRGGKAGDLGVGSTSAALTTGAPTRRYSTMAMAEHTRDARRAIQSVVSR